MNRPDPRPCPFCGTMITFGYILNDPENGPAGYHCLNGPCQRMESDLEEASFLNDLSSGRRALVIACEELEAAEELCREEDFLAGLSERDRKVIEEYDEAFERTCDLCKEPEPFCTCVRRA